MRNRKIRILHEGREFYLVDRGRTSSSRVITLLKRYDAETAKQGGGVLVKTDLGDFAAIANWSEDGLVVEKGHEDMKDVFARIVERYLEEFRVGRKRKNTRLYSFLSVDRRPLFTLSPAQPGGLSVLVYTSRKEARRAQEARTGIESRPIEIETTGELTDFLSARATEGFAGATLDERDPIFFCLDAAGAPRFLRVSLDEDSGQLEQFLLEVDGSWNRYEGDEEVTPEADADVLDRYMVDRLGPVPFLGYHEGITFHTLTPKGAPDRILSLRLPDSELGEGQPFCPLFHDLELAHAFQQDNVLDEHELRPVANLLELAKRTSAEGLSLVLHPGGHRARSATLWLHAGRVILDSFSGLWTSTDGIHFTNE